MSSELENRIETLEGEVRRLRAREEIIHTFNQYLYGADTGYEEDILDTFAEDAVLDVLNFPPDGKDMHFEGKEAIAPLYERYRSKRSIIAGGHTTSNISIVVGETASTAILSAYFTTTRPAGVQGGRYEGCLQLEGDGRWRFTELSIISTWGWKTEVEKISDPVNADRSRFSGRPAAGNR
tara:strand:- start:18 stop:557 length:540 start_codon:yes stop_codon:yes gene_type:complete